MSLSDLRANPALLKLDLYCRGARLDPALLDTSAPQHSGTSAPRTGRGLVRTRAGLGSGLEVILPGQLWTNIPVLESFAQRSPYMVRGNDDGYWLEWEGEMVAPIALSPRPAWYDARTNSGTPMQRVGTLQGTYLGVYPAKVCDYWVATPQKTNCHFCSVGLNLGVDDATEKSVEDVVEVAKAARAESGITYIDFNTGHYEGDTYLDILAPYIRRLKAEVGVLIGVQTPPHHDLSRYDALKAMGVNRVSFCFEIWDRARFREVCPGKHEAYGLDRYLDAIRYCAELGRTQPSMREPWVTNGEIIAGLEAPESSIEAINWITSVGAVPTVCVFRPLRGTDYEHLEPPSTEAMVPVFRRLYEACMEEGLPIGIAPNIHVSLVMLPEECASLSDHSYRWPRARLAVMRRVFSHLRSDLLHPPA